MLNELELFQVRTALIQAFLRERKLDGVLEVAVANPLALDHLGLQPLLALDMRLGEGTGAALGMTLCVAACRLLDEMATFSEAGVSDSDVVVEPEGE